MKTYSLSEETINKTLQYLATRPYTEVVSLINALAQAKPVADEQAAQALSTTTAPESTASN
jgi:hypothetical protein